MFKIIVIDDDINLNFLIAKVLTKNGYQVFQCYNANSAYDVLDKNYIDLIITDIMMPGIDGYKFTESLRSEKIDIPILMITAKEEFKDKVMGFNAGADDYLVKPINLEELLLRVGAILRRAKINNEKKVAIGTTVLDYNTFTVETGNEKIELPQKEFNILFKLFSYPNQIFTRTQLMNEFWGMLSESDERTIDVHINRLRDKFKDNPNFEIITVRGLGYKVVKKDE
jgi:DNA-binding response OmpR family regulator